MYKFGKRVFILGDGKSQAAVKIDPLCWHNKLLDHRVLVCHTVIKVYVLVAIGKVGEMKLVGIDKLCTIGCFLISSVYICFSYVHSLLLLG